MPSKILVIGSINGHLSEVFEKIAKLHAKQGFAFAIVAGNLFANPAVASDAQNHDLTQLLQGKVSIPLPTYFALGNQALPQSVSEKLAIDSDVCPDLTLLGRKVSIKTSEGFKLVSIGGQHTAPVEETRNQLSPTYSDRDIESAMEFKDADILVTSEWPADVTSGSKMAYHGDEQPRGVSGLGSLCTALKPRYHFSTSANYYEREPFLHRGPTPRQVTRFISLAPYGNEGKQKWIYAFSLDPSAPPPEEFIGFTASPFETKKRKAETAEHNANGYRSQHYEPDHSYRKRQRRPAPPATPQQCYFCLSNPACETHMIGSIGTEAYMTIAKGPLSERTTFPELGFPCNILIIPLPHLPTIAAIPEADRKSTHTEMLRYKESLQTMVSAKSTGADGVARLGAVTWEISRGSGVHLHWQFLPIPAEMIADGRVEAAFEVEAENLSYPRFAKSEAALAEASSGDYFKAMLWTEHKQKEMVLPLDKISHFDLQFGRSVLGKLLGLQRRRHWRDCYQSQDEEKVDAEAFTKAFEQYDFSQHE